MSEEESNNQITQNESETAQTDQQAISMASPSHQTIIQLQKSKNKMDRLLFRPSMNAQQNETNSQQPRPIVPVSTSLIASQKTKTPRGNNKNNAIINTSVTPLIQTARNQSYNKHSKIDNSIDNAGSEDDDRDITPDEFDRRNMTKLRKSVENTVQALINQEAERKTDPESTDDNNEDLDNDIISDHNENEIDDSDEDNNDNNNKNDNNNDNNNNDNEYKNNSNIELKSGTSEKANEMIDQNTNEIDAFPDDFEKSAKIDDNEKQNEANDQIIANDKNENEGINNNSNENANSIDCQNSNKTGQVDIDKNFLITQIDGAVEGQDNPTPSKNEPEETAEQYQKEGININYKDMALVPKLDLNMDDNNEEPLNDTQGKQKKQSKQESLFTESDVEAAFLEFQNNRTVPPPYMRDATVMYVHAITNEAIEDEDYDLAEKLDKDLKDLIAAFNKTYGVNNANVSSQKGTSYTMADLSSTNLQYRLDEVKKQKIIAESEWEERIKSLKESEQLKIEEIEARQQREREEFEEKCQTQEFLQKFTKPSARLLQLWKLQKGLALQHDFEGAKAMKLRAEKLQKQETDEAQQRAIASVKVNYEKLVVKQQRELECAVANGKRKISQMEIEMKKDLENKDKLSKQVETRMKEYRHPLKKSRLPPLNSSQIQSALNQIQIQPINSNSNTNSNIASPQSESALSSSSAQRDTTTSALSKRAVASRTKKKRVGNPVEQTAVLDVKIANIRSVLGDKTRNKK